MNEFLFEKILERLPDYSEQLQREVQLKQWLSEITPADLTWKQRAHAQWNAHAKPLGSLGVLEQQVEDLCTLRETLTPSINRKFALIFCGDNGVVEEGVSQTGQEVTGIVARQLAAGNSSVNKMAEVAGVEVVPVDMGMKVFADPSGKEGILPLSVVQGTANLSKGPAMTRAQTVEALCRGMELAFILAQMGADLLCAGEMGIGNTTTASAVASVLLNADPEEVTGRGAGLDDPGLSRKIEAIREGIRVNAPDSKDPLTVLQTLGGADLAGMCGFYLGAAHEKLPVLIDGFPSAVAALCAVRMAPNTTKALFASHVSAEPAGQMVLNALQKQAPVQAGMRLGEGTGAVAAVPLLEMALRVFEESYTFEEGGITPYEEFEK